MQGRALPGSLDDLLLPRLKRLRTGVRNVAKMPGAAAVRQELHVAVHAMDNAVSRLESKSGKKNTRPA